MVANWDYKTFDPLRTAAEYQNSYNATANAYNDWQNNGAAQWRHSIYGLGPEAGMSSAAGASSFSAPSNTGGFAGPEFGGGAQSGSHMMTLPGLDAMQTAGIQDFTSGWGARGSAPMAAPPAPNDAMLAENLRRLQYGQQLQQGNYNKMMGGGYAGGVLPENMMQTYQSGGQFGADSRGIRPTNPFAQSPSYGPEQAMSASYGRQGGLGGLGGFGNFGTTEVFNV